MKLFRKQASILMMLFESKTPVSGSVLSQGGRFSLKTLKREIEVINQNIAKQNGFVIVSKTGTGYEIVVSESEKFKQFREQTISQYYHYQLFKNSQADMVHYIIRRLLTSNGVFIENIADECYCSVSTVNRCIPAVKDRLQTYDLIMVNHTNNGIHIEGHEWNYRLALLNEYLIYHDFKAQDPHLKEQNLERCFLSGGAYRKLLSNAMKEVLLKENYLLTFEGFRKLMNLFILAITRQKYSGELKKDEQMFRKNDLSREAKIITEIFVKIPDSYLVHIDEIQLLSLCCFMRASHIIMFDEFKKRADSCEITELAKTFMNDIKETYHIGNIDLSSTNRDLCCNFAMLKERVAYGIHTVQPKYDKFKMMVFWF